jgi:hypothetical protein
MDGAPASIVWRINQGDLVKIRKHHYDGSLRYEYGLVLGNKRMDMETRMPCVSVYQLKDCITKTYDAGVLEIVSHA